MSLSIQDSTTGVTSSADDFVDLSAGGPGSTLAELTTSKSPQTQMAYNLSCERTTLSTHDSKGNVIAIFTQTQGPGSFGLAWKDPGGVYWSTYQGQFSNLPNRLDAQGNILDSAAVEACTHLGGSLPTASDFEKLKSYFELSNDYFTDQGKMDWAAVFPDVPLQDLDWSQNWFWTTSVDPKTSWVSVFGPVDAGLISNDHELGGEFRAVRCLLR